jgi:hypothetical protein
VEDRLKLHRIELVIEISSNEELNSVVEDVKNLACPHADKSHVGPCGRRWIVVVSQLDSDEIADWLGALNE